MRIGEEIWMKANPLAGGSSCMEELTWIVGQGADGFGEGGPAPGPQDLDSQCFSLTKEEALIPLSTVPTSVRILIYIKK